MIYRKKEKSILQKLQTKYLVTHSKDKDSNVSTNSTAVSSPSKYFASLVITPPFLLFFAFFPTGTRPVNFINTVSISLFSLPLGQFSISKSRWKPAWFENQWHSVTADICKARIEYDELKLLFTTDRNETWY